jgi:hypothetical protein
MVLQNIKKRGRVAVVIATAIVAVGTSVRAQSQTMEDQDPVARAMKRVEALMDQRASAAEAVLAGSTLVDQSAMARKQGDRARALATLKQAESIAAGVDELNRSPLIDELATIVAREKASLNEGGRKGLGQFPPDKNIPNAVPRTALARMAKYHDDFARILEEEQVPIGLLGVAMVESGFNPFALSPKGARGIWQFMPATAVRYGLTVQSGNDHRTHPEHSTRAAARYLRFLYYQFGDWKLALAAYNAGEARVQRIIDQTGVRTFEEMSRRGLLPAETRNYVPAVLAAWSNMAAIKNIGR